LRGGCRSKVIRGHASESLRWYEHNLRQSSLPPIAESKALLGAAMMWYAHGEHERSPAALTRALSLAETAGDQDLVAQIEHLFGMSNTPSATSPQAIGGLPPAWKRFVRPRLAWGSGHALSGLAEVAQASGDAAEAERLLDGATWALRDAGPWFMSLALYVRAVLVVRRQDADRAIAWVRDSLTRIRDLHDTFAFIYTLVPLKAGAVLRGEDAWAARFLVCVSVSCSVLASSFLTCR
jgi:hypothetical protein